MMSRAFSSIVGLMALVVALFPEVYIAQIIVRKECSLSCGDIGNISYPFHLRGHPRSCGDGHHQLDCENNRTTVYFYGGTSKFYVQEISYENRSIRVVDAYLEKVDQCFVHPYSFPDIYTYYRLLDNPGDYIYLVSCASPVNSSNYIDYSSCYNSSRSRHFNSSSYLVVNVSNSMEIHHSCTIHFDYPSPFIEGIPWNLTISDIKQELLRGAPFEFWDFDQLKNKQCFAAASCGDNIGNISFPFHLKGHPRSCGDGYHQLDCENNRTTVELAGVKYYVQEISYGNRSIRLVDVTINEDYCSFPRNSFQIHYRDMYYSSDPFPMMYLVSCASPVNSSNYVDFSSCVNRSSNSSSSKTKLSSYVVLNVSSSLEIHDSCTINLEYPFIEVLQLNLTISDIHQELLRGFQLDLDFPGDIRQDYKISLRVRLRYFWFAIQNGVFITAGPYIILRISIGLLCLIILLAYRFRRRHLSIDDTIEKFLQSQNNFMPIRYSYSDIKHMTKSFKDKLGQGGYGSVFKGKLRSGDLVAVKVLSTSKGNGQDFMSEVATIGRIHHVNVVRMIGFCAEGSRRALVYDFMPNGSLDKFIFSGAEKNLPLISWERMQEIAVGVARGIEYLHRGCDIQILHFDIKPHNILLDQDFIPKVSDFGLAKLYPTDDSIVSLTVARGTLGYIAPELFYKNIGGVSYKADVYSFGMLLMEMVGKRKNVNPHAERTSQVYFPYWLYDQINQGEDLQLGDDADEEEKSYARKMIIAALWCIQLKPVNRPSMSEVLQMLEGEEELLQMPPKPFLYSNDMSVEDQADNHPTGIPTSSHAVMSITMDEMLR